MADLDADVLNEGLELAMEFGPRWLQPIQPRLAVRHPHLSAEELDAYDAACRAALDFGHRQAYELLTVGGDDRIVQLRFKEAMRRHHPWISPGNLAHLFSQGRYYAWKDGAPG